MAIEAVDLLDGGGKKNTTPQKSDYRYFKVVWDGSISVKKGPNTSESIVGFLSKNEEFRVVSGASQIINSTGTWIKTYNGYVRISNNRGETYCTELMGSAYKSSIVAKNTATTVNSDPPKAAEEVTHKDTTTPTYVPTPPAPGVETTDITENSDPPTPAEETEDGSGYRPDVDTLLDFADINTSNEAATSDFINIKHISGIFGLPYQFLPDTDLRLVPSSATSVSRAGSGTGTDISLGYEYAEKIVEKIPLLFLCPGRASFMTRYSREEQENLLTQYIGGYLTSGNSSLEDLLGSNGRYYTFKYEQEEYYKFVNPMCRMAAMFLEIGDEVVFDDGVPLKNYDWRNCTQRNVSGILDAFANAGDYNSIPFYMDTETSVSESYGNSTTSSMLASTANSISDMGRELNFLFGYGTANNSRVARSVSEVTNSDNLQNLSDTIRNLLGSGNFLSNLTDHLTTVASGGKLMFPEIWQDSDFSRSYSCRFKFISPDPSNLSIFLNVLVPLFHLLGLVAPQSIINNPNGYTAPFIIRAIYKGFFNIDTGIITSMSVTKGAECQWTVEGIPTSIEVDIEIKDLYNAMGLTPIASTSGFKYDTVANTAQMDYIANCCGINIYKPEVGRQLAMWFVNNFENKILDIPANIWGSITQKVQNSILNIYRRG